MASPPDAAHDWGYLGTSYGHRNQGQRRYSSDPYSWLKGKMGKRESKCFRVACNKICLHINGHNGVWWAGVQHISPCLRVILHRQPVCFGRTHHSFGLLTWHLQMASHCLRIKSKIFYTAYKGSMLWPLPSSSLLSFGPLPFQVGARSTRSCLHFLKGTSWTEPPLLQLFPPGLKSETFEMVDP